jgi:hypothetical protein
MSTPEIIWADLPSKRGTSGHLDPRWEIMRQHPGKWCLWKTENRGTGPQTVGRHPGFEAATRNWRRNETGKAVCDLYIRYVGEPDGKP